MADFGSREEGQIFQTIGQVVGTTNPNTLDTAANCYGTVLTVPSVAFTKTTWAVVVPASTLTFDAAGFLLQMPYTTSAASGRLWFIDIGIGTDPTVTPIVTNFVVDTSGTFRNTGITAYFPIAIPAGTVISMRCAANAVTAAEARPYLTFVSAGAPANTNVCVTYGPTYTAGVSMTLAKPVTPNNGTLTTVGVKGTYAYLGASEAAATTTYPISQLILQWHNGIQGGLSTNRWLVDVAWAPVGSSLGTASLWKIALPDLGIKAEVTAAQFQQKMIGPLPIAIPEGVVLATRVSCGLSVAVANQHPGITLYGFS